MDKFQELLSKVGSQFRGSEFVNSKFHIELVQIAAVQIAVVRNCCGMKFGSKPVQILACKSENRNS